MDHLSQDHCKQSNLENKSRRKCMDYQNSVTIHPLLIDHVAKKVFDVLGWEFNQDLLSCRAVCKTWCDIVTNLMKRKKRSRKLAFKDVDNPVLQNFVTDFALTRNLPFDCFEFDVHFFVKQNIHVFHEFCVRFGKYIRKLSLTFGRHYGLDFVAMDYANIEFSRLQSLSFKCSELETMPDTSLTSTSCSWLPKKSCTLSQGLYYLLKTILSKACNLASFHFVLPARYFDGDNADISNVKFGELLSTSLPETVVNLKLSMELKADYFFELSRLKLETLEMELYGKEVNSKLIKDFLTSQSQSLKSIRFVDFHYVICDKLFDFCEFSSVKTLQIRSTDCSFSYLKFFPRLNHLVLLDGGSNFRRSSSSSKNISFKSITSLDLQFPIISPNFVEKCFASLPNVVSLRLQVTPESVKAVEKAFEIFTNLIQIQITFPDPLLKQDVDPLLTGLSLGLCSRLREEGSLADCQPPGIRRPCLLNLKCLRKFVIESEVGSIVLTEVSVRFALFCMPFLEEVIIKGEHRIPPTWLKASRETLKFTVYPSRDTDDSSDPRTYEDRYALVPYTN